MIFAYFWILEAVRGKSKETIVGIKVVQINTLEALEVRNGADAGILLPLYRF